MKSKVIISLFETVRLSVSISPRNLYNSLKSIKEIYAVISLINREEHGIQCMPWSSRIISEMLPEIHKTEKFDFVFVHV